MSDKQASKKIKVEMRADQRVTLCNIVEMDEADYNEYLRLVESSDRNIDAQINKIAERYGLNEGASQIDWGDMEETTFEVITQ